MGRKPVFEKSTVVRIRIETDVYDKIPGKKAEFIRKAVAEKMERMK